MLDSFSLRCMKLAAPGIKVLITPNIIISVDALVIDPMVICSHYNNFFAASALIEFPGCNKKDCCDKPLSA